VPDTALLIEEESEMFENEGISKKKTLIKISKNPY
jgi:hypothetical protein